MANMRVHELAKELNITSKDITDMLSNSEKTYKSVSGLTDEDRAWLATAEAQKQIAASELWAEVKAMSENDKGALRHPVLVRLRNDM